jgi:hypothetical protein
MNVLETAVESVEQINPIRLTFGLYLLQICQLICMKIMSVK